MPLTTLLTNGGLPQVCVAGKDNSSIFVTHAVNVGPYSLGSDENKFEIKSVLIQDTLDKLRFKLI